MKYVFRHHILFACAAFYIALNPGAMLHASDAGTGRVAVVVADRYPSGPAGVILEGAAVGIEKPAMLGFDGKSNCFTLDGKMLYRNPVAWREWLDILAAIQQDDRLGVSLTMDLDIITYGGLSRRNRIAGNLVRADKLLAGVCFGNQRFLGDVQLPDGYQPVKVQKRNGVIACFNLTNYEFIKKDDEYQRQKCELQIFLLAVSSKKATDGGHIPDNEATAQLETLVDQTNINHLRDHQAEYLDVPLLAKAAAYGEAAAFARFLRNSNFNLAALHEIMSTRNPSGVIAPEPAAKDAMKTMAPTTTEVTNDADKQTVDAKSTTPKPEPQAFERKEE